jgi:hypothetical protein
MTTTGGPEGAWAQQLSQVLTVLALLVQQYKYWRTTARSGTRVYLLYWYTRTNSDAQQLSQLPGQMQREGSTATSGSGGGLAVASASRYRQVCALKLLVYAP